MKYNRRTLLVGLGVLPAVLSTTIPCYGHINAINNAAVASASNLNPVKQAEKSLREMGESIHRAKSAAVDLIRECSRENTMLSGGEIDFIGTDVIPILPATAEGLGGDSYLPPRKSYLDLHMAQLTMLLPILKQDIAATNSPDPAQATSTSKFDVEMQQSLDDAVLHYQNLKTLTAGPDFDRQAIVKEATAVHKDIIAIDKVRKKVYGEIKHDPNDKAIEKQAGQPSTGTSSNTGSSPAK